MTNLALVTTIPMLIVTAQQASEIPRFEMGHPVLSIAGNLELSFHI